MLKKYHVLMSLLALLFSCTTFSMEANKKCDYNDWHCRGTFYVNTGAIYSHLFLNNNVITLLPSFTTTPLDAFPIDLRGIRFAFGDRIRNHHRFTYEVSYSQLLSSVKKNNYVQVSRGSKALGISLSYSLNPGNRLEVRAVTAGLVDSGSFHIKGIINENHESNVINFTDLFPALGSSATYHINSKFSIKLTEVYQFIHYNLNAKAALVTSLVLHYYPE